MHFGDLMPCKTTFIDAQTPGSDQKENFTIIGGGVSESPDQHVHIAIPHGFNIGAAGQPPKYRNSFHSHRMVEVFFVLSGRWRFFWGHWGHWPVKWAGGATTLAPGDTMSVPENLAHSAVPSMTGEASLFHIIATDDPAGPTWQG